MQTCPNSFGDCYIVAEEVLSQQWCASDQHSEVVALRFTHTNRRNSASRHFNDFTTANSYSLASLRSEADRSCHVRGDSRYAGSPIHQHGECL